MRRRHTKECSISATRTQTRTAFCATGCAASVSGSRRRSEQLKSSTLPEAEAREEQADRLLNYNHAKEHLAAAIDRDSEFDRRLSWLRATMEVNDQVRAELAAANSMLPDGMPELDCQLPLSCIEERVLAKEQVLCWCDAGTTNLFRMSRSGNCRHADARSQGGGTIVHRHVGRKTTHPDPFAAGKPRPSQTTVGHDLIETLAP